MDHLNRRQFLSTLGRGSLGLLALSIAPACEFIHIEARNLSDTPFITPQDDGVWYWQSGQGSAKEDAPRIAPADWRLAISADDDLLNESIDLQDLRRFAADGHEITYFKTLRCVFSAATGAPIVSFVANGLFTGIPLRSLLDDLEIPSELLKIHTFGADGFTSNIPLARLFDDTRLPPILAYELNGHPLSRLRGGPVRLIIPEMWGYKNMKWIERLHLTADASPFGKYETERFPNDPRIHDSGVMGLGSTLFPPLHRNAEVQGPDITVTGIAVAGNASIEEVLISIDDGEEFSARLIGDSPDNVRDNLAPELVPLLSRAEQDDAWPHDNIWVIWEHTFTGLTSGEHTLRVRARDSSGRDQPDSGGDPLDAATTIRVTFRLL